MAFPLQVYNLYKVNPVVGSFLKKEALNGVVEIAWKFVTLPIPVVVSQPKNMIKHYITVNSVIGMPNSKCHLYIPGQ